MLSRGNELLQRITRGTSESVLAQFFLSPAGRTHRSGNNPLPENCPKLPARCQNSFERNWSKKELPGFCGAKPPSVPRLHFAFTAEKVPWDFVFKKGNGNFLCSLPPNWCHPLCIPTGKEKASSASKDKFRGIKPILSWEFAPVINPSSCLNFNVASSHPLWDSAVPSTPCPEKGLKFGSLSWPINTVGEFKSSALDIFTLIQKLPCCSCCRISSFSHIYFNTRISELNKWLEQYFQKFSFWSKNILCSYFPAPMSIDGIKYFLFWELKQIWRLSPTPSTFAQQLFLEGWALCPRHSPLCSLHPPSSLKIIWIASSHSSFSWNNFLLQWCCELHRFSCSLYLMKITKAGMQLFLRTPMITLTALSQPFHDFYFLSWWKKEQKQGLTRSSRQLWCCLVTQRWICSEQLTENPLLSKNTNFTLNFFSLWTRENWLSTRSGP